MKKYFVYTQIPFFWNPAVGAGADIVLLYGHLLPRLEYNVL
jgi:hypothetical protein